MLDMAWHGQDNQAVNSVAEFEKAIMDKTNVLPSIPGLNMSCSFSHIFQGSYSSGYYSYKWAEVLDADVAHFKANGIFNKEIADSFKRTTSCQQVDLSIPWYYISDLRPRARC